MNEETMKAKPRAGNKKKPYGPNIVRAWFETVFQYALAGLENERGFLSRRNWTFRFHNRKLEYLAPIAEHLPAAARQNLEQFVSFFPEVAVQIGEHDSCERQLEKSCNAYFVSLLESRHFREAFHDVAQGAPQALGREFSSHFGAYSSEADFEGILAEYLVNNIETLPSYYSTAQLWNQYRDRFLEIVSAPDLAPFGKAAAESGQSMPDAADDLVAMLKSTRFKLSLEFDVPYVAERYATHRC
jgi:hypothetical protein